MGRLARPLEGSGERGSTAGREPVGEHERRGQWGQRYGRAPDRAATIGTLEGRTSHLDPWSGIASYSLYLVLTSRRDGRVLPAPPAHQVMA